ncbi:MAG: serine/threonine-protein kinase [Myxococcota bacterium]
MRRNSAIPRTTSFAGGRYVLLRELGRGGTAIVHLANDLHHQRECAIKVLAPKFAAREDIRQRFRRECEAMHQIRHPNVLKVYTWGIADGSMFLVSEFAAGGSVGTWVRQNGPMGPVRAIEVITQVCDGVGAAHAMGVVHRDVKPDNVLVSGDGTIRVCDFGIAQVRVMDEDPLTRTGSSMGTMGFMSPEQIDQPRDVDRRADVYSIGTTLWYLLCARVPPHAFQADPWENGIPGPLCPVLSRATAFRRDQRHSDLAELKAELLQVAPRLPADPTDAEPLATGGPDEVPTESPSNETHSDEPEITWLDTGE